MQNIARFHPAEFSRLSNPLFAVVQMKMGLVYYMHDSSESLEDSFTLSASAYALERRSLPVTVAVTVVPVNDEPPTLTRNTGLEVKSHKPESFETNGDTNSQ